MQHSHMDLSTASVKEELLHFLISLGRMGEAILGYKFALLITKLASKKQKSLNRNKPGSAGH